MRVKELQEELSKLNPEAEVIILGSDYYSRCVEAYQSEEDIQVESGLGKHNVVRPVVII